MKNTFIVLICILGCISMVSSQELSYGLKGGLNYTMGGQITGLNPNAGNTSLQQYSTDTYEGQSNFGFHGGAFVQVNFGKFFVRPEIVYTALETEFQFPEYNSVYAVEKFDIPLLIGYNVYGPVDVFLGPIYSNILHSSISEAQGNPVIVVQNSPINFQAGFNVDLGRRFGIDVRYERTLSPAELQGLDFPNFSTDAGMLNTANFDDARLNQIIVGVYFNIGGPGLNEGRRRACY